MMLAQAKVEKGNKRYIERSKLVEIMSNQIKTRKYDREYQTGKSS